MRHRSLFWALLFIALPLAATAVEDEARIDGLVSGLMRTHHVPGAVVVVIRDGRVWLAKGYGVADIESGAPVDPDTTRFRVASNSKLFVATAVMQLVGRGELDLDADVNDYLEAFQLEPGFGAPVTLRNLLTHTGGFDDRFIATAEPLDAEPTALVEYLARDMPPRVRPPGKVISYSNHGYALAGHLIERASGLEFGKYIESHIFEPLGMARSHFGIPTPVPPGTARPYAWRGGRHVDIGYDRLRDGPAGDLLTTGSDMARFLAAHLRGGSEVGVLLDPESMREMHHTQFRMAPELSGWTLGFSEVVHGERRALAHGGSWRGFGTNAFVLPEEGTAWFVSTNLDYHPEFMNALIEGFWEILAPVETPLVPEALPDFAERASDYTGSYLPNRRVRSTILKLSDLLFEMRLSEGDDGTLVLGGAMGGRDPVRLALLDEDRVVATRGFPRGVFLRDEGGEVIRLVLENRALDRIPGYASPRNHVALAVSASLLFVASVVGWLLGALARAVAGGAPSPVHLRARLVGGAAALLLTALLVSLALLSADPNQWNIMIELPWMLRAGTWLPLVCLPLALWMPVECVRGFRSAAPLARLHYLLLTAGVFVILAGAVHWNLLPWKLLA
jgi:CubicO group peptidase (beta-lactamase class C family)